MRVSSYQVKLTSVPQVHFRDLFFLFKLVKTPRHTFFSKFKVVSSPEMLSHFILTTFHDEIKRKVDKI